MPSEQRREITIDENLQRDVDTRARVSMIRFYDALEKAVKRYRPDAYIPYVTRLFRDRRIDQRRRYYLPPYRLLHSIEANCAFHKSGYSETPDWSAIARIMNVYTQHPDVIQAGAISGNLERFVLMMWREQMVLQQYESWQYIARVWELFVESPKMSDISTLLKQTYDLTCTEWIQLCFLTWAAAKSNPKSSFSKRTMLGYEGSPVRESALDAFLRFSSQSPRQIGERFHANRKEYSPKYHSLIRPVFLEYPIVAFDGGAMESPHEGLLFQHSGTGLYRLCRDIPDFYGAFSHGFERYVETLLTYMKERGTLLREAELQKVRKGKTCDFLLDTPDSIILIECKACMQTSNFVTDAAILNDNSTGKVAKGLLQIAATARDIASGVFTPLGIDATKNVLGIIVTFGDIPFANSAWYFDTFFSGRLKGDTPNGLLPAGKMTKKPIVISVSVLQTLVRVLNTIDTSFAALYAEKEKQSYFVVGDWDPYLTQLLRTYKGKIAGLPHVDRNVQRIYDSLGVPKWARSSPESNSEDSQSAVHT